MDEKDRDDLLSRLDERSARVEKALFGNGQPGIVTIIADHSARLKAFDDIYSASLATQGPLMQEYGALKDKVAKLEHDTAGPRERKATGLAAYGALLTALVTILSHVLGVTIPPAK